MVKKPLSVICCQLSVEGKQPGPPAPTHNTQRTTHNGSSGFTLLELMVVMAVIAILTMIVVPSFTANVKHAREAVLREDLHTMRGAIDSYTYDKQKAPQALDDLVQAGYLKEMPKDPFTQRTDTWMPEQGSDLTTVDEVEPGITNVHSGSQLPSSEGTTYNTW